MSGSPVREARRLTATCLAAGLTQTDGAAQIGRLCWMCRGVLGPREAVPRAHLVPVSLVIDSCEDEDVEDQERSSYCDGHTQSGGVGGETSFCHGEVALVLREGGRGGHHGGRDEDGVPALAGGVVAHHDAVRLCLQYLSSATQNGREHFTIFFVEINATD